MASRKSSLLAWTVDFLAGRIYISFNKSAAYSMRCRRSWPFLRSIVIQLAHDDIFLKERVFILFHFFIVEFFFLFSSRIFFYRCDLWSIRIKSKRGCTQSKNRLKTPSGNTVPMFSKCRARKGGGRGGWACQRWTQQHRSNPLLSLQSSPSVIYLAFCWLRMSLIGFESIAGPINPTSRNGSWQQTNLSF